ncbi:hypothetical protein [Moorena sp. SIO4A5]|uniref:hypothetical protein n=1 Tax=Moorena sp. SIO4A5 TaxID=2607838 RepID=UPI0013CBD8C1|nr:hypothetical protein [Moorena sp. SIO4A5]NEO23047.1 hypothetical protein [Moorena sp. SIO4A5]
MTMVALVLPFCINVSVQSDSPKETLRDRPLVMLRDQQSCAKGDRSHQVKYQGGLPISTLRLFSGKCEIVYWIDCGCILDHI